jgi:hypothetical protein
LVLLCDISHHLNDFNTKLQGQYKLISHSFRTVTASEIKLNLFWKQMADVNLCHFSSCDLLHMDGPVKCSLPSVHAVEIIDSLAKNFKMRFNDFHSHSINIP